MAATERTDCLDVVCLFPRQQNKSLSLGSAADPIGHRRWHCSICCLCYYNCCCCCCCCCLFSCGVSFTRETSARQQHMAANVFARRGAGAPHRLLGADLLGALLQQRHMQQQQQQLCCFAQAARASIAYDFRCCCCCCCCCCRPGPAAAAAAAAAAAVHLAAARNIADAGVSRIRAVAGVCTAAAAA